MLFFYNLIQLLALALFWPVVLALVVCKAKYRLRIPKRLGLGLDDVLQNLPDNRPRIWIHALSVGEVTSTASFVRALRRRYPGAVLLFSAATTSGQRYAETIADFPVDAIVSFPLDILPVVSRFLRRVRPDLFILVETDFWPNFLAALQRQKVPAMLLNGRISQQSYTRYRAFRPFFLPLFNSFQVMAMQRRQDMEKMAELGVDGGRLRVLGNLKYDAVLPDSATVTALTREEMGIPAGSPVLIAGSTHAGEEEIVCAVYRRLLARFPALFLIIAPRNIERAEAVTRIVQQGGCVVARRSEKGVALSQALVLDTLGELAGLYAVADVAFIGGSMVDYAGHNPLEPAVFGVPVVFGVHMDDFADVVEEMITEQCARQVRSAEELFREINGLLEDDILRKKTGDAARSFVAARQGVSRRHVELVEEVLK